MNFWEHFFRLLLRRPIPAIEALYWHITRRRVRARNRLRVASADLSFAYAIWITNNEPTYAFAPDVNTITAKWSWLPRFRIQIHSAQCATRSELRKSIASVEKQIYREWHLIENSSGSTIMPLAGSPGEYFVPLRAGDILSERALLQFAEALQTNRTATILYGDEDQIDDHGRRTRPWFKPRWNEELFLAQDYISSICAIESKLAARAVAKSQGSFSTMLLAATAEAKHILHVPQILVHTKGRAEPELSRLYSVALHIAPRGASCVPGPFGTVKIEWPLPDELPLVSIIIPTKDNLDVLRPCVKSLLERTHYRNFEILIVDNASVENATARYFEEIRKHERVRILTYELPFNYSAINNFAAAHARGTFLSLLNNDTEVIEPGWLTELMRYAIRPEIGAVGAKLLYGDGSIQHAGVVVGIGDAAGHAHRFLPAGAAGYFRMPHVSQFISAVTGACLVVEKEKFQAVGGFDEEGLPVAFNDVDLCLKLQAAGWRNVYVPHAVLVHHESKSRVSDMAPSQFERYQRELDVLQERWGTKSYADPLHNPNLDRYSETYVFHL